MDYVSNYKFGSDESYLFSKKIKTLLTNKKVLDLGCGTGEYLKYFGENSLGLDISLNNLEKAMEKNTRAVKMDLNQPQDLNEVFDAVFTSHLLEHLDSPINLLRYAHKHLSPKGLLVISVPNELCLIQLRYPYYTHDGNHLYSFTIANMKELLSTTGFEVLDVYYDYYTALTKRLKINRFLSVINAFPPIVKYPFSWAFWFVARKI